VQVPAQSSKCILPFRASVKLTIQPPYKWQWEEEILVQSLGLTGETVNPFRFQLFSCIFCLRSLFSA
jgi:hypothetical protein